MDILSNLMPFKSSAEDKLRIESWANIERLEPSNQVFSSFINPDEMTLNYAVLTEKSATPGATGNSGAFLGTTPFEVSLKFFLDGTNATGVTPNISGKANEFVKNKIIEFYKTTGYDGEGHRTRYLRIIWPGLIWYRANQSEFDCVLKSASINYKLFRHDGTPIRAIINAVFTEQRDPKKVELEDNPKSADLTHIRIVKEGDNLPSMVKEVYGDFKYYLQVAKVNNLVNFRDLEPGKRLIFPPFDKNSKRVSNV